MFCSESSMYFRLASSNSIPPFSADQIAIVSGMRFGMKPADFRSSPSQTVNSLLSLRISTQVLGNEARSEGMPLASNNSSLYHMA